MSIVQTLVFVVLLLIVSSGVIISSIQKKYSPFLTGGTFGIEASFVSVLGYILVSLLAVVLIRKKQLSNQ